MKVPAYPERRTRSPRSYVVSRIVVGVAVNVLVKSVMTLAPTCADLVTHIVAVSAFAVYHLTQMPLSLHIERKKLDSVIAGVFKHCNGCACAFVTANKLPKAFYAVCTAYFTCGYNVVFHSIHAYLYVRLPGG